MKYSQEVMGYALAFLQWNSGSRGHGRAKMQSDWKTYSRRVPLQLVHDVEACWLEAVEAEHRTEVAAQIEAEKLEKYQLGLVFDAPRARNEDPGTSHDAAHSMSKGAAGRQRKEILRLLAGAHDGHGYVHSEIDERLGWKNATASRRLKELRDALLVRRNGEKRKTGSGREAHVHTITELGLEALQETT